jgi:Immunity protein 42
MLIGDPLRFAIESGITQAYERLSFRALGFFAIHICGCCYGRCTPDATMLACSFDEVQRRVVGRGSHTASFSSEPDGGKIADAFRDASYAPDQEHENFFGIPQPQFAKIFNVNKIVWAPDGDKAFDDGSYVLHFDVGRRSRLIGFNSRTEDYHHNPNTLRDLWLEGDEFYSVLERWRQEFEAEWKAAPKTSEMTSRR